MFKKLICITALVALASCGGSSGSSPTSYHSSGITGVVQKGPLIYGSYVNAYLLDEKLNPTGQSYVTRTTDDLGNFTISSNISSSLVELIATGYYFDELTGSLSTSPTTLNAIVDLTVNPKPTINVLTTLQEPRIKVLLASGKTYSEAMQQSAKEVLSVFGVDAEKIDGYQSLYGMQINGNKDADSVLLAASTILGKMSTTATVGTASSQAAQLSYFLSRIASDVANFGTLKEPSIQNAIKNAQSDINLTAVRVNVESYYSNRGITLVAPKFEEWIDKDGTGILPKRKITATAQSFINNTNQNPNEVVTSNGIQINGVGSANVYIELTGSSGSPVLLKNGTALSGSFASAAEGDEFKIRTTSPSWGGSSTYSLRTGSQTLDYVVSTRPLVVTFYQGINSNTGCQSQGGAGSDFKYFATPFYTATNDFATNSSVVSKYIATGVMQGGPTSGPLVPLRIEIQSDNNGEPSGTVLASAVVGNYGLEGTGSVANDRSNNSFDTRGTIPTQGYLGSAGLALQSNTKYWAVNVYSGATRPDVARCGPPEPTAYGRTKISSDGSTWSNGNVGYLPRVVLYE